MVNLNLYKTLPSKTKSVSYNKYPYKVLFLMELQEKHAALYNGMNHSLYLAIREWNELPDGASRKERVDSLIQLADCVNHRSGVRN